MSLARRWETIEVGARLEVGFLRMITILEFHLDDRFAPALRTLDLTDRVLYVGTFSKTRVSVASLGLHSGAPRHSRPILYRAKLLDDLGCATMEQARLEPSSKAASMKRHLVRP